MPINPANFTTNIDNAYLPLKPGTTTYYRSNDGSENTKVEVTRETKIIDGVECVVVLDRVFNPNGKLIEKTFDYYAQDLDGNVWYFGEDVKNFVHGVFQDTDGSWLAGVDGAEPGIIMKAAPVVGESLHSGERARNRRRRGNRPEPRCQCSHTLWVLRSDPKDIRVQSARTCAQRAKVLRGWRRLRACQGPH